MVKAMIQLKGTQRILIIPVTSHFFLTHAGKYKEVIANRQVPAPAKSIVQMQQVIVNEYVNASLAGPVHAGADQYAGIS